MPVEYQIDVSQRLVSARCVGIMTHEEAFGYQSDVWSRAEVCGYDELIDVSALTSVTFPAAANTRELASLSVLNDRISGGGKLAIMAPQDWAYGLGRMYQACRDLDPKSTKRVCVFRTLPEALEFLGRGADVVPSHMAAEKASCAVTSR
jgi:hypothetical protein